MRLRLSIMKGVALLLCVSACELRAEMKVSFFRQAGAPLDTSIRNELDHAVDLASAWLVGCRNADGSWGSTTGRVARTALVQLALTGASPVLPDAAAQAAVWLDRHAAADPTCIEDRAWRLIALLNASRDADGRAALAQRLLREARPAAPEPDAPWQRQLLWQDALALAGEAAPSAEPSGQAAERLKILAETWPPSGQASPEELWPDVHLINRVGNGALLLAGAPLDWRSDVARAIINSQRRSQTGGGFWGPEDLDARIRQTAFAVLALLEL